ncbi:MAG: hypothetical protein ACR2KZ_18755 [Segetibacter sp.]
MRLTPPNKATTYEDVCVFNFDNKGSFTFKKLLRTLSDAASGNEAIIQASNAAILV